MNKASVSLQAKYQSIVTFRENNLGQPMEQFCRQHKINPSTFYYWRKKFTCSPQRKEATHTRFLPVVVEKPSPHFVHNQPCFEILFPQGSTMRISDKVDHHSLRTIIEVLAGTRQ